jgi:MFS family permease
MLDVLTVGRRRVQGVFYGWWIVAAACIIQSLNGGLLGQGFTIYFLPLQTEFGWSRALLSSGYALSHVESGFLGPLEGWLADRFGPRRVVLVGVLLLGAGFILLSRVQSIVPFFGAFLVISAGSSLAGFLPLSVAVLNWFVRKRSLALGVALAGGGLGGLIVPMVAWGLTNHGWRSTAVVSGLVIWLIGFPMALLVRHKPEQYGYLPDGDSPAPSKELVQEHLAASTAPKSGAEPDVSFSATEALRTSAFWLIAAGHASAVLMVSAVSLHLAPHLVQRLDVSLETAGGVVAAVLIVSVVGRIAGGFLADRMNKQVLLVVCMLSHTVGLLLLAYATSMAQVFLFTVFHGLAWGARAPTQNAIRAEYFGRTSIGLILGIASIFVTAASVIAPIFAGWLADLQGDYRMAFTILAVMTGFGSLFFAFARKPLRRPHALAE